VARNERDSESRHERFSWPHESNHTRLVRKAALSASQKLKAYKKAPTAFMVGAFLLVVISVRFVVSELIEVVALSIEKPLALGAIERYPRLWPAWQFRLEVLALFVYGLP